MKPAICLLHALILSAVTAFGVPFRVVTFNIEANRDAFGNITESLNDPGTSDFNSVRDILLRINADVVCLQELANADVAGGTNGSTSSDVHSLATALGLPYVYIPTNAGAFDFSLRNAVLSRYPFLDIQDIGSGDYLDTIGSVGTGGGTARDVARVMPAVVVDVPGASQPATIVTLHAKSGTAPSDRFRRAVEFARVEQYFVNNGLDASDNILVLGDFNLSSFTDTFTAEPNGLPTTWNRGSEIALPITYSTDPDFYFSSPYNMVAVDALDVNGVDDATFETGSTIDFIIPTPALTVLGSEIYRSNLDVDNATGLAKSGNPLNNTTTTIASDHFAVFADFDLAGDLFMQASVSQPSVSENEPAGTATLDVTLFRPVGNTNTYVVNLSSGDPTEATLASSSLSFGPADTTLSVDIIPQTDGVVDGTQSVTFTASSSGLTNATAMIDVLDIEVAEYVFTAAGTTIVETFDTLTGTDNPLNWTSSPAGNWLGIDDGTAIIPGKYAYGTSEKALGLLAGTTTTFTTQYRNDTGAPITALQVSYDAEQWGVTTDGAAENWSVELIIDETPTSLSPLTFTADTTGSATPGAATPLSTVMTSLSIPNGARFQLRFTATPGAGSGSPSRDVFINEFHYDNIGTDTGEFIEVVIAPGFTGTAADVACYFYNGDSGGTYSPNSVTLSDFITGDTVNGYTFYSFFPSSIQNGDRDGFALVDTRTNTVLHFISYEGTFTATTGPAIGLTSIDIGETQSNSTTPVGKDSIGLTGSGSDSTDLTWTKFVGLAHTPGALNSGQSLNTPGAPNQGIALDNVSVALLIDTDGDGIPDLTDPDDDNDGMSDAEELVFGTDPLDSSSRYLMTLEYPSAVAGSVRLTFPTSTGRTYVVESSLSLSDWSTVATYAGTGNSQVADVPVDPKEDKRFYRIRAMLP